MQKLIKHTRHQTRSKALIDIKSPKIAVNPHSNTAMWMYKYDFPLLWLNFIVTMAYKAKKL